MPSADPFETTRQFLQEYCADNSLEEMVNLIEGMVMVNAGPIFQGVQAIEDLFSLSLPQGALLKLVTQDANIQLEYPSDFTARVWLNGLAKHIRNELHHNLLPFQPIRARLLRVFPPADERFPHDLLLYPSDYPLPEYWQDVWMKHDLFYTVFMKEWDGETCPSCQIPSIRKATHPRSTYASPYPSSASNESFTSYQCVSCHCGWTELTKTSNT